MWKLLTTLWEQIRGNVWWDSIKWGVAGMIALATAIWGSFSVIPGPLLFILFLGALGAILFVINELMRLFNRPGGNHRSPTKPQQEPAEQSLAWLEALADEDSRDMTHRVYLDNRDISAHLPAHLEAAEPYVDLRVHVCNFSVYTLHLSHIEGKFTFRGNFLHYPPEILSAHPQLPHAVPFILMLRQRFLPTTAQQIVTEGQLHLGTGEAALHFTYQDRYGETQQVRIAFGNLLTTPLH